ALVTRPVLRRRRGVATTSQVIASLTKAEARWWHERAEDSWDSSVAALRADLGPCGIRGVHRGRLLLRTRSGDAVAVVDPHRGVLGDHRRRRAVARPPRHRHGQRPRDGAADRRRDTGGLLALDHRLPDYCATDCFDAPR